VKILKIPLAIPLVRSSLWPVVCPSPTPLFSLYQSHITYTDPSSHEHDQEDDDGEENSPYETDEPLSTPPPHVSSLSFDPSSCSGERASPQLKEVTLSSSAQWTEIYHQSFAIIHHLFNKCSLVHADISEYNLLLHRGTKVFAIDFGQAVDLSHPLSLEYLKRDVTSLSRFFSSKGVRVVSVDTGVEFITKHRDEGESRIISRPILEDGEIIEWLNSQVGLNG
jgi:hypothetical protein